MKFKILFLVLFSLLNLASCKDDNKKEVSIDTPKIKTQQEPEVNIDGLSSSSLWDGIRSESEFEDVFASYTENRFKEKKKAISMDGMSEYSMIINQDGLNLEKEITISIWYKPISFKGSGNDVVLYKASDDTKKAPFVQYFIGVSGNEYPSDKARGSFKFALSINGNYVSVKTTIDFWLPNTWYNLTGTYDGETIKFYVNGKLVNSRVVEGKIDIYDTNLFVGRKNEAAKFYTPGNYDNLRIYNRALTKEEIMLLAN